MAEEKQSSAEPVSGIASDYQAPAIEEVVSRDELTREVAYAGVGTLIIN